MKAGTRICLLGGCAIFAVSAQIPRFQHVVVIFQENRTCDNLFQGLCTPPFGSAGQARKKRHDQQGSANELDYRHEISHQVRKRDFSLNERFVHSLPAAGDKQFVCPGDGEEQAERNAYQQDGIWFQITATSNANWTNRFQSNSCSPSGDVL